MPDCNCPAVFYAGKFAGGCLLDADAAGVFPLTLKAEPSKIFDYFSNMNAVPLKMAKMYFRKVTRLDSSEICLDADMIRVLIAIDETKDIGKVAREVSMDAPTIKATISKLLELHLIEPVQARGVYLDEAFIHALKQNLSRAVGPMAEILIEDVATDMNLSAGEIPQGQAAEFIGSLAMEIPDEESSVRFKKAMLELIKKQ
ncbi:MAG: hypothetical protein AMJ54_14615 [Deltaproteobacteria bacterium SG8_13]|nr:MAG: hypothetical protein AMJ54_14615 [Deltaproteobacteria bacterium SG8_13]